MTKCRSSLRALRLRMAMPPTLEEMAALVRQHGARCTAGHLSVVERGLKPPGPKLRGALRLVLGLSEAQMARACRGARRHRRKK